MCYSHVLFWCALQQSCKVDVSSSYTDGGVGDGGLTQVMAEQGFIYCLTGNIQFIVDALNYWSWYNMLHYLYRAFPL